MQGARFCFGAAVLTAAGLGACLLTLSLSTHGFSGYDVSPMIDAGWRVYQRQVPGRDFVVTFPASLYLLTALSFHLFGVTWRALALGACGVYGILLVLGLRVGALVQAAWGTRTALALAMVYFAAQTIPLISINYLWHASLTESFGVYAAYAALAAMLAGSLAKRRLRREALVHLTLACACLLLSKPNTAFPVLLLCLFTLLRSGARRVQVATVAAGAMALAAGALAVVHVTLWGMVSAYFGLTGRLLPKAFANGILYAFYPRYGLANLLVYALLAPAVFAAGSLAWHRRGELRRSSTSVLGLGCILVSILGMGTNFDFKLTDSPLALLGLAILACSGLAEGPALRLRSAVATGTLLLLALYFGRTRFRMQIVGTWADDKCGAQVHFEDTFFGRMTACPAVPATLAEVDRTLAASHTKHVFFGPSMEFLYAARHLPAPAHLPDWWDPGSSYPLRKDGEIAQAWEADRFDVLIFNKDEDRGQLPPGVQAALATRYEPVPGTAWIHVYRRR